MSTTPTLAVVNGRPMAKSTDVAEHFEKQHKHVLRDINNLLERLGEFGRSNFGPISYLDEYNREQPMFEMTRDGFMFLVMGYTGEKADAFKIAYITEFNRMEAALQGQAATPEEAPEQLEEEDDLQFVKLQVDERHSVTLCRSSEPRDSCGDLVPLIDSREVAWLFEKNHFPLLRQLRNNPALAKEVDRHFEWRSYQNHFKQWLPCFLMTRDGFTMLTHRWRRPRYEDMELDFLASDRERVYKAFDQLAQGQQLALMTEGAS